MNIFKWFKRKPKVPRGSLAVRRLAERRNVKIDQLDLNSDDTLNDLLMLGLVLSNDGTFYYDDPHYKAQPHPGLSTNILDEPASSHAAGLNAGEVLDTYKNIDLPSEAPSAGWSDISLGGGWFDSGSSDSGGGFDSGGGSDGGGGFD